MIEQTFMVTGPADLDISVPAGRVTIEEGGDGSVEVSVDTSTPENWRVSQSGDAISIGMERTGFGRGGRARVHVLTPAGSSLRLNTASADVRIRPSLGRVTINTASSDVDLGDVDSAAVKTASGDISIARVVGDLTIRTASGEVRVNDVGGSTALTTASGDISIESAAGSVSATSASGDISVRRYSGDDLEAATMSGDITVGLPAGTGVKLVANTLSGSVHLPDKRKAAVSPDRQITVRLKSVSGDLRVRRID